MKTRTQIICFASVALALALSGCASSSNYKKGEATASGLKEAAAKIETGEQKVDQTVAAMNALVNAPQADLRPQYKKFSSSVDELGSLARHVQESFASMSAKGKEFFAQWEKEAAAINSEDIRAQSTLRKAEVATALEGVKRSYATTEAAFRPFMSDLRDLQKYFGTDLTTGGVNAMKTTVAKATREGSKVKESLRGLAAEFKKLGVSMASVAPAPAK